MQNKYSSESEKFPISLQVVTYVVTRPGRELLFTVVSQDEKYKAKVWILMTRNSFLFFVPFS